MRRMTWITLALTFSLAGCLSEQANPALTQSAVGGGRIDAGSIDGKYDDLGEPWLQDEDAGASTDEDAGYEAEDGGTDAG